MAKTMGAAAKDKGRNDQRQGSRGSQSRRTDRTSQGEGSGGTRASSLAIEEWAIERVIPYDKNPRVNDSAVDAVARSIQEFGFRQPIVVDAKGVVIVGHTRLKAAKKLGLATVPVHVAKMTHAQAKAYRIADNQTATIAEWDKELLPIEILELKEMDFDLELLGFDKLELDNLLRLDNEGLCDPDEVPEPPADPITKPGDLWVLGDHRLLCGDSTKAEDVAKVMAGAQAGLCFTSPPYGQQRDYTKESKGFDWDTLMQGVFANLPMEPAGQVLVNLGLIHRDCEWIPYWDQWIEWMRVQGWRRFGWYVWDQGFGLPGNWNGRLAPSFEFVFHFNRQQVEPDKWVAKNEQNVKARKHGQSTMRDKSGELKAFTSPEASSQANKIPDSVIRETRQVGKVSGGNDHPAVFSVAFSTHVVKCWPGNVYEPFSGSGTTLIACEQLNRRCYAIEISPQYVDVAVKRWEQFTGKTAHRE